MILRLLSIYYFSLECLYLYFLLFLFYVRTDQIPFLFSLICFLVIGNLFLYFSLQKKQVSQVIPFLAGLICGVTIYILGMDLFPSLLCTFFIFQRMNAFINDSSLWMEERKKLPVIFYCSSFIVFISAWIADYPYLNWIYSILIVFTVLFSLGRFFQQAVINEEIKNMNGLILSLTFAAIITGIFTTILPIFKWIFFNSIEYLLKIVAFVASPLFNLVEQNHINPKPKGPKEELLINQNPLPQQTQKPTNEYIVQNIPSWVWILLIVLVLTIIWFFIRRKRLISATTDLDKVSLEIEYEPTNFTRAEKRKFFRQSTPTDPIRKLIFQLQKFAYKHQKGRHKHETLNEWFTRNNFPHYDQLLNEYDNVRYGDGKFNGNEKDFEEQVQHIKHEIKNKDNNKE